jgi:hypothetical protein
VCAHSMTGASIVLHLSPMYNQRRGASPIYVSTGCLGGSHQADRCKQRGSTHNTRQSGAGCCLVGHHSRYMKWPLDAETLTCRLDAGAGDWHARPHARLMLRVAASAVTSEAQTNSLDPIYLEIWPMNDNQVSCLPSIAKESV